MSETRDKRHRNDLDLFVLALIDSGVATPYQLQRAAGLSQGATIPVLRRLMASGLVRAKEPGLRGRISHAVTARGNKLLKTDWRDLIEAGPSGELDSDLRVALLALWATGNHQLAAGYLRKSAAQRLESSQSRRERDDLSGLPPLALWYRKLRSVSVAARATGESVAANEMAKALTRLATARWRR